MGLLSGKLITNDTPSFKMTEVPTVTDWNRAVVSLTQAMMGAVSSNFRMVVLERLDDKWHAQYWLETESPEDREEISDIDWEFAHFMEFTPTSFEISVVGTDPLIVSVPTRSRLTVFRRRERDNGAGA